MSGGDRNESGPFCDEVCGLRPGGRAAACAIIAYWDKIADWFYNLADKVEEKKADCCHASEYDDYDDWENC